MNEMDRELQELLNSNAKKKNDVTMKSVFTALAAGLLAGLLYIALLSWFVMLMLGALAGYFDFTAPGFFVTLSGMVLLSMAIGLFRKTDK